MKRFLILLSLLFCSFAIADTINLDWYVDGNSYAQTTCEIGGGVTLPTEPTKYGYDFIGWSEIFNRGTFANWASVPKVVATYSEDAYASNTPQENDFIIVNDMSDFPELSERKIMIQIKRQETLENTTSSNKWADCETFVDGFSFGCNDQNNSNLIIQNGAYTDRFGIWGWAGRWAANDAPVVYLGDTYQPGEFFVTLLKKSKNNGNHYAYYINGYPYSGKWLLRYHGNWSDLGRGGWVAEKSLD